MAQFQTNPLLLAAIVVALVATVAALGADRAADRMMVTFAPPHEADGELVADVAQLTDRVERLRGQQFVRKPKIEVLPAVEIVASIRESAPTVGAIAAKKAAAKETLQRISGMRAENPSPESYGFPSGLYWPATDTIFIPTEALGRPDLPVEQILVHELTHALDHQRFGLDEPGPTRSSEADEAVRALDEGSASFVEQLFVDRHSDGRPSSTQMLAEQYHTYDPDTYAHVDGAAVALPYLLGVRFVSTLHRRGGWNLVNEAFHHPPTTMGQIAHPLRWLRGDDYTRPTMIKPEPSSRWRSLGFGPFGEVDTNLLLQASFTPHSSRQAAEGLDSGRWTVWRTRSAPTTCEIPCPEHTVAAIAWRWENRQEFEQFARAGHGILELGLDAPRLNDMVWRVDGGYASIAGRLPGGRTMQPGIAPTWVMAFTPTARLARRIANDTSRVASAVGQHHAGDPTPGA